VTLTPEEIEAWIEASACYTSQITGLFPTLIEQNLEILSTRAPIVANPLWNLHQRVAKHNGLRERIEHSLKNHIARSGGEKYWHVSSSLSRDR
jgi:hypothetical protein